jgi:membrane-associated phospholipid phosphatase
VSRKAGLRAPEIIFLCYFAYTAVVAVCQARASAAAGALLTFLAVAALFAALVFLARSHPVAIRVWRDWIPLGLVIVAYREMDWFSDAHKLHALEKSWQAIDRTILREYGVGAAIGSAGWLIPAYLETCYLLVYGTGYAMMGIVYWAKRRDAADRVLALYLTGTLLAYALFPYFPSEPPRVLFHELMPVIGSPVRSLNLWLVNGAGIHSSVFPSAHVSSAFSAALALLFFIPEKRWAGIGMLIYAASVAIATIYGRYHYAVDAMAGIAVSVVAAAAVLIFRAGIGPDQANHAHGQSFR